MEVTIHQPIKVQAKTLDLCIKVRDEFAADLLTQDGQKLVGYEGYVPAFFPEGGGDYLVLKIDVDTGVITNWRRPATEELETFIQEAEC
jgi:hypothetical protein